MSELVLFILWLFLPFTEQHQFDRTVNNRIMIEMWTMNAGCSSFYNLISLVIRCCLGKSHVSNLIKWKSKEKETSKRNRWRTTTWNDQVHCRRWRMTNGKAKRSSKKKTDQENLFFSLTSFTPFAHPNTHCYCNMLIINGQFVNKQQRKKKGKNLNNNNFTLPFAVEAAHSPHWMHVFFTVDCLFDALEITGWIEILAHSFTCLSSNLHQFVRKGPILWNYWKLLMLHRKRKWSKKKRTRISKAPYPAVEKIAERNFCELRCIAENRDFTQQSMAMAIQWGNLCQAHISTNPFCFIMKRNWNLTSNMCISYDNGYLACISTNFTGD